MGIKVRMDEPGVDRERRGMHVVCRRGIETLNDYQSGQVLAALNARRGYALTVAAHRVMTRRRDLFRGQNAFCYTQVRADCCFLAEWCV